MKRPSWKRGDTLTIFPDTDVESYVNYLNSIGCRTKVVDDKIIVTSVILKGEKKKDLQSIGKRMKHIRTLMYFSLNELADEIGISPELLDDWETGRKLPKGRGLENFCWFSGATKEYVLEGKGEWIDEVKEIMNELHHNGQDS